jgi:hypothetical protein
MQQQLAHMQQQAPPELQQLAQLDEPRIHWLLVVLGIGVVNILGLQAVLKVLQASRDSECETLFPLAGSSGGGAEIGQAPVVCKGRQLGFSTSKHSNDRGISCTICASMHAACGAGH